MSPQSGSPCPSPIEAATAASFANLPYMAQAFVGQSDQAYGQIAAKVLEWITQALEAQVAAQQVMAAKIAQPIAAGLATQEAGIASVQGAVTSSIQAGLAGLQAPGGTVQQGITPGQYLFSVFSGRSPTGFRAPQIVSRQQAGILATDQEWCFQGSWQEWYDALAFVQQPSAQLPPGACPLPGGPAGPGPVEPTTGTCPTGYQVWQLTGPPGTPASCQILCGGAAAPGPGYVPYGSVQDLAGAQALVSTLCGTGIQPPNVGGPQYYGGCVSGAPVSWVVGAPAPAGVSGQVGPFADSATALAAAGACPPPPPPPPPTPGACVCVVPPPTQGMPATCWQVDLCDWGKFTDALAEGLYKGLCKFFGDDDCFRKHMALAICDGLCLWVNSPQCACPTHDAERWILENCEDGAGKALGGWAGKIGDTIVNSGGLDQLVARAASLLTAAGSGGGTIP